MLCEKIQNTLRAAMPVWKVFLERVLNFRGADGGSRRRRLAIRLCLFWCLGYIFQAVFFGEALEAASTAQYLAAGVFITASLAIFTVIVLLMPFRDGEDFTLNAARLFGDTIVSSVFCIVAFSLLYVGTGLTQGTATIYPDAATALYFSSVTFSTLGYGDFSPTQNWRLAASTQALIGNLHLGMIVGSTFAAIRN